MATTIALAGNPNCGKTTMFNALTGANQYVGNWPGVTVERKEGKLKKSRETVVADLPGIYSLSPYTQEEVVSRDYLMSSAPNVILDIVDATNIERNLYLTTQLLELGKPTVIALNMMDALKKSGSTIDVRKLSEKLGVEIVETQALYGKGVQEAAAKAVEISRSNATQVTAKFADDVESAISEIDKILPASVDAKLRRWFDIKLIERDKNVYNRLSLSEADKAKIEEVVANLEKARDNDSESIITDERYNYIADVLDGVLKKSGNRLTFSDKVDRVVTNRILGLPIFLLVMYFVYYISVSTVGSMGTDWANDQLMGEDGWHLFGIGSSAYEEAAGEFEDASAIADASDKRDAYKAAAQKIVDTYAVQSQICAASAKGDSMVTIGDKTFALADSAVVNTAKAFVAEGAELSVLPEAENAEVSDGEEGEEKEPAEAIVMTYKRAQAILADKDEEINPAYITFEREAEEGEEPTVDSVAFNAENIAAAKAVVEKGEPDPSDYGIFIPGLTAFVSGLLEKGGANEVLSDALVNGVIGGIGAVVGFTPQMFILFILLSLIEDCGYMVRIAFVMDRIFRHFGLSGKSFIPLLVSSGCGIPGIMASKTIENDNDRRLTIMTTTWIPCGAKLPVLACMAGVIAAQMGSGSWVAPSMYFIGIASVLMAAIMLKKTKPFHGEAAPFVMELPQYHLPQPKTVLLHAWERTKGFLIKAGTILFLACLVMWFISTYGWETPAPEAEQEVAAEVVETPVMAVDGIQILGTEKASAAEETAEEESFTALTHDSENLEFGIVENQANSIIARIGDKLRYIFIPLGFGGEQGGWQAAASSLSGFSAKEGIVVTMGVLGGVDGDDADAALEEEEATNKVVAAVKTWFPTGLAAFCFLLFNLLDSPCLAAIATMARELNDRKWFWFAIVFQNVWAWVMTFIVYQIGSVVMGSGFTAWTAIACVFVAAILFQLFRPDPYKGKTFGSVRSVDAIASQK